MTAYAFPQEIKVYDAVSGLWKTVGVDQGATLHDYFMAHAPHHPQAWFSPTMATTRPAADSEQERAAWDAEREKQRWLQWPRAWADEMMTRRVA